MWYTQQNGVFVSHLCLHPCAGIPTVQADWKSDHHEGSYRRKYQSSGAEYLSSHPCSWFCGGYWKDSSDANQIENWTIIRKLQTKNISEFLRWCWIFLQYPTSHVCPHAFVLAHGFLEDTERIPVVERDWKLDHCHGSYKQKYFKVLASYHALVLSL